MQQESSVTSTQAQDSGEELQSREGFLNRFAPKFVRDAREIFRTDGTRGVIKRYGWKVFAAFFCYYLIRDSFLYLLLPYLIAQGLLS